MLPSSPAYLLVRKADCSESRSPPNAMAATGAVRHGREPVCQGPVTHGGAVADTNSMRWLSVRRADHWQGAAPGPPTAHGGGRAGRCRLTAGRVADPAPPLPSWPQGWAGRAPGGDRCGLAGVAAGWSCCSHPSETRGQQATPSWPRTVAVTVDWPHWPGALRPSHVKLRPQPGGAPSSAVTVSVSRCHNIAAAVTA